MINLTKGQKIDLTKGRNLRGITVSVGWKPAGYRSTQPKKEEKKGGFFNTLGRVLTGEARIGDALNAAVDSTRNIINDAVDTRPTDYSSGRSIDIDTSIVMYRNGRYMGQNDLVYFGHQEHSSGSVKLSGDNRQGSTKGDAENIWIDFSRIPSDIDEMYVIVNIYNCSSNGQHFGMITDAYASMTDDRGEALCNYDLDEDFSDKTGIVVGRIYRYNNDWKFEALGEGNKAISISGLIQQIKR